MKKNKTVSYVVVGAIFTLVIGFIAFSSDVSTTVAFDGPPGTAGIGSGAFAVNATGSVAIGTNTFSASKLRVAGSIESTTGGFVFPDGTTQITAATSGGVTSTPAGYVTPGTFNSVAGTGGNYTFPASIVLVSTTNSTSGVIYKNGGRFMHDFTDAGTFGQNTFVGLNSGNFTMAGTGTESSYNTGLGFSTLYSNTTGSDNTGLGYYALYANTTGSNNTATGYGALDNNTTGAQNTANGAGALLLNVSGGANTATGYNALRANTGGNNTAVGATALYSNTSGDYNSAFGAQSLYTNTTGNNNSAYGINSMYYNTDGRYNTALGHSALMNNTLANYNTGVGYAALAGNATGTYNSALGVDSLHGAGGSYNAGVGYQALYSNNSGINNAALGYGAIFGNTSGFDNVGVGHAALYNNTTGNNNTAVGPYAGYNGGVTLSTLTSSTFLGYGANASVNGLTNATAIGAGAQVAKNNQIMIGNSAVAETVLRGNVGIGTTSPSVYKVDIQGAGPVASSGQVIAWVGRTTPAEAGMFLGYHANGSVSDYPVVRAGGSSLGLALGGDSAAINALFIENGGEVGIGTIAPTAKLEVNTNNSYPTAGIKLTGTGADMTLQLQNTSAAGRNWHIMSAGTGSGLAGQFRIYDATAGADRLTIDTSGNVGIGATALDRLHVAGDIRIGTGTTGCLKDADATVIAGSCSSDIRFKKDIAPIVNVLDKLALLQPVDFNWRADEFPDKHFGTARSFGLIAQDVEKVMPDLVTDDEDGYKAVRYNKLPLLLIEGVKELNAKVDRIGEVVADGILKVKELVAEKISAKKVVTDGIEMRDKETGSIYCVVISNGEMQKTPGSCQ